ncbi:MAG: undecaprenyl diphosphate synthase family protein [Bacteroidales bacterium]|jgi:undecaprenyl diphosphate synthase|nr:undecaprenyl diphosphate synthase family protein [Bacteroidales bacterium]
MDIKHIGIIPDGNRRWAQKNDLDLVEAYNKFFKKICDIIEHLRKKNIDMVSFYIISLENFQREERDINSMLQALDLALGDVLLNLVENEDVKINCVGNIDLLSETTKKKIEYIESLSKGKVEIVVNLLIAYNPFDEINCIIAGHNKIGIENLVISKKVDLIIRSAGNPVRLSNFLPLQSGYAAIHVLDDFFLDIKNDVLNKIIHQHAGVDMKYGK